MSRKKPIPIRVPRLIRDGEEGIDIAEAIMSATPEQPFHLIIEGFPLVAVVWTNGNAFRGYMAEEKDL